MSPYVASTLVTLAVPSRPNGPRLTGRESEILTWVARGKTNQEIAGIVGCAPKTVEKHLENIYTKLEVPNRAGAVANALIGGVIRL